MRFASIFHCLRVESAQRRPMARYLPGPLMTHVSTIAAAERRQVKAGSERGRQSWRPAVSPVAAALAANRNVSGPLRLRQLWPIQEGEKTKREPSLLLLLLRGCQLILVDGT